MLETGNISPDRARLTEEYKLLWKTFPNLFGEAADLSLAEGLIFALRDKDSRILLKSTNKSVRAHFGIENHFITNNTSLPANEINVLYINDGKQWALELSFLNNQGGNASSGFSLEWQGEYKVNRHEPNPLNLYYFVDHEFFNSFDYRIEVDASGISKVFKIFKSRKKDNEDLVFSRQEPNWDQLTQRKFEEFEMINSDFRLLNIKVVTKKDLAQIHFDPTLPFTGGGDLPEINFNLPVYLEPKKL